MGEIENLLNPVVHQLCKCANREKLIVKPVYFQRAVLTIFTVNEAS